MGHIKGKRINGCVLASFSGRHIIADGQSELNRAARCRIGKKLAAFGMACVMVLSLAVTSLANPAEAADVGVIAITTDENAVNNANASDIITYGDQQEGSEIIVESGIEPADNKEQEPFGDESNTGVPDTNETDTTNPGTPDSSDSEETGSSATDNSENTTTPDTPSDSDNNENGEDNNGSKGADGEGEETPAPEESDPVIDEEVVMDPETVANDTLTATTLPVSDYNLEFTNTVIGCNGESDDVFTFEAACTGNASVLESNATVTGNGIGKFQLSFPAAGTYTVSITCTTGTDGDHMGDERTLEVVLAVTGSAGSYTVTENSRTFKLNGTTTGVQTSFVAKYNRGFSWSANTMKQAEEIMAEMTTEEKVGQLFILHYPNDGSGSIAQATERINTYHPGAYLVFAAMFNNNTPDGVRNKVNAAQAASMADTGIPLFFSVDEEGGNVVRISDKSAYGHTKFQSQLSMANKGVSAIEADALDKALFLQDLGMNVNHAPVADVSGPGGYMYSRERVYGGDPLKVAEYVAASVRGHNAVDNIGTSIKHFPGYGATSSDTHNGFAINDLSRGDFDYGDLLPFYEGIAAGSKSVMVTHNIINCMDSENPASLSAAVIDVLRNDMNFDGVIMTDDLNMGAIIQAVGEGNAALACLQAGVDMPMCYDPEKQVPKVLAAVNNGTLSMSRVEESCLRVLCWKIDMGLIDKEYPDNPPVPEEQEAEWTSADEQTVETGAFDIMWAKAIAQGGTVKMLLDVDTTGNKTVASNDVTLDLNGHRLNFTSGTNGFLVNGGNFTITDNVDPIVKDTGDADTSEQASYNAVRRELLYYTQEENGTVTRHDVNFDSCGSVMGNVSGRLIRVTSGAFTLEGGVLSHDAGAVAGTTASTTINMTGGAIVGCDIVGDRISDTEQGTGAGIYSKGTVKVSGGYIAGNTLTHALARGAGLFLDTGANGTISGGVFACNKSSVNGGAMYGMGSTTTTITGGVFACNETAEQGGVMFIIGSSTGTTLTVSGKTMVTMNTAGTNGGAFYEMTGWGTGGKSTINVENGLFTGNNAQNGGAIRTGSSATNGGALNITGGKFLYNEASVSGGALYVQGATNGSSVKNAIFTSNTANNGGAMYLDTSISTTIADIEVSQNQATNNGGGIYIASGTVAMSNSNIKANVAGSNGGGIYHNGTVLSFNGDICISRNRVGVSGNNLYLPSGKTVTLLNTLGANSSIGVTTAVAPTENAPVPVATASQTAMLNNSLNFFYSDKAGCSPSLQSSQIMLSLGNSGTQGPEIKFDGILFQYYADVTSLATTGEETRRLEIVDTSGRNLPTNGTTPVIRYLYLNEDGSVKTTSALTEIYKAQDLRKSELTSLEGLNKFAAEKGYYEVTEIWVLKEGGYPGSITMTDWEIYPWSPDLNFTTDPTKVNDNTFFVDTGSVVRFVSAAVTGNYSGPVAMYDYDISDGNLYGSLEDAIAQTNPIAVNDQNTREMDGKPSYFHTYHSGINSDDNYTGEGKHFAFGNSNSYTGYGTETRDGYNFNSANRGKEATGKVHFKLCHFGMVQGLDENGHIIYNPEISVPNLFDEGTAIGKTVYPDYKLNFIRHGDQYILSSVGGLEPYASGLENFGHPGIYDGVQHKTVIWTNNFWPMDGVASYGTDSHDPKFGNDKANAVKRYAPNPGNSNNQAEMPKSDDAQDHNAYFGMQYAMAFTLNEDYVGPLEYTFFGDDDLWVFLDGQLVCDIGGVHQSTGAFVNLWDYLTEKDYGDHELRIYYLERGASGSTCWMRFNLPHLRTITDEVVDFPGSLRIEKFVEGSDTTEEFEFTVSLTLNDAGGSELADEFIYSGSKSGILASGDTINLAAGEYIVIPNLPIGTQYTVVETPVTGFEITSTGETGIINDGQSTAIFTNKAKTKTGILRISKTVVSESMGDEIDVIPAGGDGIPDKYQYEVYYQAINGTVSFSSAVLTKRNSEGNLDENGTVVVTDAEMPETAPDTGYTDGAWTPYNPLNQEVEPGTIFTYEYTPKAEPSAPQRADLYGLLGNFVAVKCTSPGAELPHDIKTYSTVSSWNDVSVGPVQKDGEDYICTLTLNGNTYAEFYKFEKPFGTGVSHTLKAGEQARKFVTLTWDDSTAKWVSGQAKNTVLATFEVICKDPCAHTNVSYDDNGDGTHDGVCDQCHETVVNHEPHTNSNGSGMCDKCGCKIIITITWYDENGTVLLDGPKSFNGGEPEPTTSVIPTKPADGTCTYRFDRWIRSEDENGNIAYTASYASLTPRAITVRYIDSQGNIINSDTVHGTSGLAYTLTTAPDTLDQDGNHYLLNDTLPKTVVASENTIYIKYAVDNIGGGTTGNDPDGIPDEIEVVVYYSTNTGAYGTVQSDFQTWNLGSTGATGTIRLSNVATTTMLSRTYFSNWTQGGKIISSDAILDVDFAVVAGGTYQIMANFGRNTGGGGGGGGGGNGGTGT